MSGLKEIGEFGLIERLTGFLPGHPDVLEAVGDDCAVVKVGEKLLLLSCDASIEDIHFSQTFMGPYDIGFRAGASALSDIAAMGGKPLFVLVTLACPSDTDTAFLDELYRGLNSAITAAGALIIGGDTARTAGGVLLDVIVIGEAVAGRYRTRADAEAGDAVLVTGWPGSAALGLLEMQSGEQNSAHTQKFLSPRPRIEEGLWLAEHDEVHAMIDLSDGFLQDAAHIADRSGLGLDLQREALPMEDSFSNKAQRLNASPEELVLTGGEEYELILAVAPDYAEALMEAFSAKFSLPLHQLGHFTEEWDDIRIDEEACASKGYEHF